VPSGEFELAYREVMARPDPDWHLWPAQKYEQNASWFAAAFHCEQVLKSRLADEAAKSLLERAREQLRKPKLARTRS
jgi:hypothetical protein